MKTKTRLGSTEVLIGLNPATCVPGLYWWLTLVSESLANRHGVPLSALTEPALEHKRLGRGQHLLRFHVRPGAWRERRPELDTLRRRRQSRTCASR